MSNLDTRQRDPNVPKSENMIQYAFNQYNQMRDPIETIKSTPNIYRTVKRAREEYKAAKTATQAKEEQTPIVTAQEIKDEMYR